MGKEIILGDQKSLFEFSAIDMDGVNINFAEKFKDQVCLVVNVACE